MKTAKPIPNATIFLNDKYNLRLKDILRVRSDSTGFYKIAGIKAGTYIINAWTSYRAMNQRYAQVIESNRIKVDSSLTIDFVFSEIDFKYSLHYRFHPLEAFTPRKKRSSDDVAFAAVHPQIYINSKRDTFGASFIEKINDIKNNGKSTSAVAYFKWTLIDWNRPPYPSGSCRFLIYWLICHL